ncbi:MAG: MFS transporter [Desulfovibrio sp.]|jgi:putative MFS transporter|nr:MFS transporter [Desulfovibrio sp.]
MNTNDLNGNTINQLSLRLDRLPVSRFHISVLIVAALSLLFDTLDTVVTGFVLAELRPLWKFGTETIGIVSSIGLSGYLIGSFCSGFVADRFGRKKTILFTLILYSLFSASRGLTDNMTSFAVLNFFTWLFVGAESSTVPPYLAELWPSRVRGKLNGWMMSFFAMGIAFSPIWALLLIPNFGWRFALFLTLPFAILGGLMRSGLPESPRWLIKKGRLKEAEETVTWIEKKIEKRTGKALPPIPAQQTTAAAPAGPAITARDLLSPRYRKITWMLWAAWFAEYGVLYSFMTFVPTLLALEGHSIVRSFQYSVVIYITVIPAYILGGYVVEWLDRKYTAMLALTATAICGTLFGMSTEPPQIMLFGSMTSFFLALGSTAIYTYTPELYPTEIRATGMGIASAWGRAGAILLLLTFGVFAVVEGKLVLFLISDVILFVAIVALAIFGPSTKGRRLEDTSTGTA